MIKEIKEIVYVDVCVCGVVISGYISLFSSLSLFLSLVGFCNKSVYAIREVLIIGLSQGWEKGVVEVH